MLLIAQFVGINAYIISYSAFITHHVVMEVAVKEKQGPKESLNMKGHQDMKNSMAFTHKGLV